MCALTKERREIRRVKFIGHQNSTNKCR
uniref:Uncharacterized protein n=1 Tax=Rhizophora mucronata TaxID=61149 RepID=A0A2P2NFM2_RHIMU